MIWTVTSTFFNCLLLGQHLSDIYHDINKRDETAIRPLSIFKTLTPTLYQALGSVSHGAIHAKTVSLSSAVHSIGKIMYSS